MLDFVHTKRRTGVTLNEVLVVVVILGILAGLLLPAIQASRESMRRSHCANNMRQIGIALQTYHDFHTRLPPGYVPSPVAITGRWAHEHASYAWSALILPHLDQMALHDRLNMSRQDLDARISAADAAQVVATPVASFRCPSDVAELTFASAPIEDRLRRLNRRQIGPPVYGAISSYVANCGYYEPLHPFSPNVGAAWPEAGNRRTGPNNGPFYTGSRMRVSDIVDGSSNTIAIGERAFFQGSSMWIGSANILGVFAGGAGVCLGRVYWPLNAVPDPPGVRVAPGSPMIITGETTSRDGFSSYHPGGANFVFADGSVRQISESIESHTTSSSNADVAHPVAESHLLGAYQHLGIMNDGHSVALE